MEYNNLIGQKITDTIKIYKCDNMELMAQTPDKYYDLAIVDPPYGINMGGGKIGNSKTNYKLFAGGDTSIPDDKYFYEIFRISKNQIIWGANYMIQNLLPRSGWIVWDKKQPEKFTMAMGELAWSSFNIPLKIYYQRIVSAYNIRIHPTQKPVALYKWLLHNYAKEGDKILDTHLGSGSIAIACHDYRFDLTACELDVDYYEAAAKRIKAHVSQLQLF